MARVPHSFLYQNKFYLFKILRCCIIFQLVLGYMSSFGLYELLKVSFAIQKLLFVCLFIFAFVSLA